MHQSGSKFFSLNSFIRHTFPYAIYMTNLILLYTFTFNWCMVNEYVREHVAEHPLVIINDIKQTRKIKWNIFQFLFKQVIIEMIITSLMQFH